MKYQASVQFPGMIHTTALFAFQELCSDPVRSDTTQQSVSDSCADWLLCAFCL